MKLGKFFLLLVIPSVAFAYAILWRDATGSGWDTSEGGPAGGVVGYIKGVINKEDGRVAWRSGDIVVLKNGDNINAWKYTPNGNWISSGIPDSEPDYPEKEGSGGGQTGGGTGDGDDGWFRDDDEGNMDLGNNSDCGPNEFTLYCES